MKLLAHPSCEGRRWSHLRRKQKSVGFPVCPFATTKLSNAKLICRRCYFEWFCKHATYSAHSSRPRGGRSANEQSSQLNPQSLRNYLKTPVSCFRVFLSIFMAHFLQCSHSKLHQNSKRSKNDKQR